MVKMVRCKVRPGHRFSHIDRADDNRRVIAKPNDIVSVSEVVAKRFTNALLPVDSKVKEENRKVDVTKANKALAGKTPEQIEEEASVEDKKPVKETKSATATSK